jgi:hypothetical protein
MAEREDVASAALDSVSQIPESSQIGARDMVKLNRIG